MPRNSDELPKLLHWFASVNNRQRAVPNSFTFEAICFLITKNLYSIFPRCSTEYLDTTDGSPGCRFSSPRIFLLAGLDGDVQDVHSLDALVPLQREDKLRRHWMEDSTRLKVSK